MDMTIAYQNKATEKGRKFIGQTAAADIRSGDFTWDFGPCNFREVRDNGDGTVTLNPGPRERTVPATKRIGIYR